MKNEMKMCLKYSLHLYSYKKLEFFPEESMGPAGLKQCNRRKIDQSFTVFHDFDFG